MSETEARSDAGQAGARGNRPPAAGQQPETRTDAAAGGQRNARPPAGAQQQPRRSTAPLSDGELAEITGVCTRVPGLGRIVLGLVRNRSARVVVPETALGGELFSIVSELDRLSHRAAVSLTRNLSPEKMQLKAAFDLQAVNLIQPIADLTATLAVQFDNPQNSIVRHAETKRLLRVKLAEKRAEKEQREGAGEPAPAADSKPPAAERKTKRAAAASEPAAAEVVAP